MRGRLLLLALPVLLAACGSPDRVARRWTPPAGTFPGLEVVAIDRWSRTAGVGRQFLELRCVHRPGRRVRREYWPGPDWQGEVRWTPGEVRYDPGWKRSPNFPGLVFTTAELRRLGNCPV